MIVPKITYILGLTSISKSKFDELTSRLLQPSIQKQQFSGTTEKGISLGHKNWGGLQRLDMNAQQGSGNSVQMAKAGRDKYHKGTLFKIAYLSWD